MGLNSACIPGLRYLSMRQNLLHSVETLSRLQSASGAPTFLHQNSVKMLSLKYSSRVLNININTHIQTESFANIFPAYITIFLTDSLQIMQYTTVLSIEDVYQSTHDATKSWDCIYTVISLLNKTFLIKIFFINFVYKEILDKLLSFYW